MISERPITVLVDNCINSLSDSMQGIIKEQKIIWGDTIHEVKVLGYERKPMPNADQEWKREQIKCLPTVGRIAREGKSSCIRTMNYKMSHGNGRAHSLRVLLVTYLRMLPSNT